jgi:hypothetical protein
MPPGNFCHGSWQILAVQFCHGPWQFSDLLRVGQIKGPHSPDIPRGEAGHAWELGLDVLGQPLNDGLSPTVGALALDDRAADLPVKFDQLAVDG